ncbi:MAG: YkgJ family cysteine cluster protein [Acidobacteriota bacterium]|nr:YkgJ family cysteine cluster protein [Acidobacteriota bacterium]
MQLPARDAELVQIMDAALSDAAHRAGNWLTCRPGCTQCCHGTFRINALDAARLHTGVVDLRAKNPGAAGALQQRARTWISENSADFPGDRATGVLETSREEAFEDFANDAPCPALNPDTGLCDVYAHRPMTCRVFGPPVRTESEGGAGLGCCELCFVGASSEEIAACEMLVPHELEAEMLAKIDDLSETVVAYALLLD